MNGGVSRVAAPMCGDLEARPSWANNMIVRRGERRVVESCGDRAKVPTSWATEFAEVVYLAKCKFGVSQDLTCALKKQKIV